jgi:hypothetical protein
LSFAQGVMRTGSVRFITLWAPNRGTSIELKSDGFLEILVDRRRARVIPNNSGSRNTVRSIAAFDTSSMLDEIAIPTSERCPLRSKH